MTLETLIFDMLSRPLSEIGHPIAVWERDGSVKAVDFGTGHSAVFQFSPMPWNRQWAIRGREWFHFHGTTRKCQGFDESDLPMRSGGNVLPSTWIASEEGDRAILVANCTPRRSGRDQPSQPGVHFYRLTDDSLTLLNRTPIPHVAWTSWIEDGDVILAGMTPRRRLEWGEEHYALGRPALLRCSMGKECWEELPWSGSGNVDLLRDYPHSFNLRHPAMSKRMRTEAWIASERTADGDRILVAGLGQEGIPELDSLDTRSDVPLRGEHLCRRQRKSASD